MFAFPTCWRITRRHKSINGSGSGSNAISTLSHRMAMKCEFVFLFNKYVERSVFAVPGVLDLSLPGHSRHVQQHLQPRRDFVLAICYTRFDGRRPGVRSTVTMRVADSS